MIELEHVSFSYTDKPIFNDFNLTINEGDFVFLLGPNGCGKTTLLKLIDGLIKPSSGYLKFKGERYRYEKSFLRTLRESVGFVFQNPDVQIFASTVFQELSFGLMTKGLKREEIHQITKKFLIEWNLDQYALHNPFKLSYGYKKLLTIASVLITSPQVVLLDEPTNYLDEQNLEYLIQKLFELRKDNVTIVVATHDYAFLNYFSEISKIVHISRRTGK